MRQLLNKPHRPPKIILRSPAWTWRISGPGVALVKKERTLPSGVPIGARVLPTPGIKSRTEDQTHAEFRCTFPSWSLHALKEVDNMLWWRCVSPAVRLYRSNVNTALPRLVRSQSTAAGGYEHILVSSPKPGVGLSKHAKYDYSPVAHTCSHTEPTEGAQCAFQPLDRRAQ